MVFIIRWATIEKAMEIVTFCFPISLFILFPYTEFRRIYFTHLLSLTEICILEYQDVSYCQTCNRDQRCEDMCHLCIESIHIRKDRNLYLLPLPSSWPHPHQVNLSIRLLAPTLYPLLVRPYPSGMTTMFASVCVLLHGLTCPYVKSPKCT